MQMRNFEVCRSDVFSKQAEPEIAELFGDVERLLILSMNTAGCYERDGTLRQFAFEGCKGNALSGTGHGCGYRVSGLRFRVSSFEFRVPSFEVQVSSFGFQGSNPKSQVNVET